MGVTVVNPIPMMQPTYVMRLPPCAVINSRHSIVIERTHAEGGVAGVILSPSGRPLRGVTVELLLPSRGGDGQFRSGKRCETNSRGHFQFKLRRGALFGISIAASSRLPIEEFDEWPLGLGGDRFQIRVRWGGRLVGDISGPGDKVKHEYQVSLEPEGGSEGVGGTWFASGTIDWLGLTRGEYRVSVKYRDARRRNGRWLSGHVAPSRIRLERAMKRVHFAVSACRA